MGFDRAMCEDALARYDYNAELALNYLLGWKSILKFLFKIIQFFNKIRVLNILKIRNGV